MTLKAVLLDVDGTLVDSNQLHVDAWVEAFRSHGLAVWPRRIHEQIGKGGDLLVKAFVSDETLGRKINALHTELFVEQYQPREKRLPGVRELLERMKAAGLRLVLATSAKETELKGHLKVLECEDLLDAQTTADDAGHSKPCPDIFQAALERLKDVKPEEAMVLGDSPYDAEAATRAGMSMVGVLTGGFTEEKLRSSGACRIYRDLPDLLRRYDESPLARIAAGKTSCANSARSTM